MYIKNPLNFVEWDIKSFLLVLFSVHIAMLGVIGLDIVNFKIPLIRQFIGFIYLTFVPGLLLLRLLRLKKISLLEKSLFTIALSLVTLMFSGFFANQIVVFFGEKSSFTTLLFYVIFSIVSILFIACYILERNTVYDPSFSTLNYNIIPLLIYLLLIAFLTIFGTYMVNNYHSNTLLLITTLLIASIIFLVLFERFIPEMMYPFVLFVLSISLLYHNSLISSTLYGYDIHQEYFASNLVKTLGIWNHDIHTNINAMLSIVMLAPIYSTICDINLTYVFKIVYPFLFSFTPLGMYFIYRKQVNNSKIAFFSIFYFISVYPFYTEMLALARQEIAELFLVLIVLVIISDYELYKKKLLFIIFSFGLATSHYGLSYLFIFLCVVGYTFLIFMNKKSEIFNLKTIFFFFMFAISWYIFISSGSIFNTVINLLDNLYYTMFHELFQTNAVSLATKDTPSLCGTLLRLSYFSSIFLIIIGFIQSLITYKNSNAEEEIHFSKEYISLSFASICSLMVFLITSSTGMNIYRLFHISMIFLSLFCILGGLFLFGFIGRYIKRIIPAYHTKKNFKLLSIFLAFFMLLNIGFIQEIIDDYPTSVSLSQESMKSGGLDSSMLLYRYYIPIQDVCGSMWLSKNRNDTIDIYADETAARFVLTSYGMMPNQKYLYNNNIDYFNSYIYYRYPNVIYNLICKENSNMYEYVETTEFSQITDNKERVYSSGYNIIYR